MIQWLPHTIIAHRGASSLAPENTLPAIEKAAAGGYTWVECDVSLTMDNVPVLLHDATLERVTNGKGQLADIAYQDLLTLDAGSWFSQTFQGTRVPSLTEILQYVSTTSLGINLDLKPAESANTADLTDFAERVLAIVAAHWPKQQPLLLSSTSLACIKAFFLIHPALHYGIIMDSWRPDWQTVCKTLSLVSVHMNHTLLSAERVASMRAAGYQVLAYTVDDPQRAQQLFDWGVNAIFSNRLLPS